MSLNVRETLPLVFLADGSIERLPGRSFAIVRDIASVETSLRQKEAARQVVSVDLDDLERAVAPAGAHQPVGRTLGSRDINGILLTGCRGLADIQAADVALGVIEAETGRNPGSISIIAAFGATPGSFLSSPGLGGGSARLSALMLDEDALAAAIGVTEGTNVSGCAAIAYARGVMILQAAAAGIPCFWLLPAGVTRADEIARLRAMALEHGFRDVAVRDAAQWQALMAGDAGR